MIKLYEKKEDDGDEQYPFGSATEEMEKDLKRRYPYKEMSPEKYAALVAYDSCIFSLHLHKYKDKELEIWIHTLGKILTTKGLVEHYQATLLTSEEMDFIKSKSIKPVVLCPYCEMPLRTAQAKQCRHCFMDWHDPSNITLLSCRKTET